MTTNPERCQQLEAFFAAHAGRLQRTVARHARTDSEVIDDACAAAWTALVRRTDITLDARGYSWLTTVAIREAWKLHAARYQEVPVGAFQAGSHGHDDEDVPEPANPLALDTETLALDRIQHAADLEAFNALKPRERQTLYLKGLGYRYHEIAQLTGSTYTAVNRRITEGRRALRRAVSTPTDPVPATLEGGEEPARRP